MTKRAYAYGIVAIAVVSLFGAAAYLYVSGTHQKTPVATVWAKEQLAVTANPHATKAAQFILRKGGSAVDAAIAAQLVLSLVEPQSSGIGGGGFILVAEAGGSLRAYDGRETAPKAVSGRMFLTGEGRPRPFDEYGLGGLSVGVPGAIAVMSMAHQKHGRLPWKALFQPAIELAEEGFVVSPKLASALGKLTIGHLDPEFRKLYFQVDGSPVHTGHIVQDEAFANTLKRVADQGAIAFYEGPIAKAIVDRVRSAPNPGRMTAGDLKQYRAVERIPACLLYRSYKICTTPAPSGGPTMLQVIGLLRDTSADELKPGSLSQVHLFTQATKLAYADRAKWFADPDFARVPERELLEAGYLKSRAVWINPSYDMGQARAGQPTVKQGRLPSYVPQRPQASHGTTHISIVDGRGQTVSMTMSVQSNFGAQIRAAGFVLNNELTDFSVVPETDGNPVANAVAPGKRPLSAMSPTIVFDKAGAVVAVVGSPGGRDIIAYNAQALVDLLDGDASVSEAATNGHFIGVDGTTYIELNSKLLWMTPKLVSMGHTVRPRELSSGLNLVRKTNEGFEGASDKRGEGQALGN